MYRTPRIIFHAMIFSLYLFPAPLSADSTDDMLQCMADCIIEEGESEQATCKQRCAKIGVDMKQHQNKDCMAMYKQCKKDCEGDTECRKECKQDLMNCV